MKSFSTKYFAGCLHHDGLRSEDEEVFSSEGGENQVCPKQDLAPIQNTSLRETGDIIVIAIDMVFFIVIVIFILSALFSLSLSLSSLALHLCKH